MLTRPVNLEPWQEKFAQMIQEAGFQRVEYENLVGGVVAIHSGLKL
jgi:2-methoxy-6-polyprenyl-1,4-benzoquinol methylase